MTKRKRNRKKSNSALWAVVAVLVIILLATTCPSHEDHRQAVGTAIREYADAEITRGSDGSNAGNLFANTLTTYLVNHLADKLLDQVFSTDKYLIFSIGTIRCPDGEKERVSFGILGHVYTFNADDIVEHISSLDS